jgi:hypothetical protein
MHAHFISPLPSSDSSSQGDSDSDDFGTSNEPHTSSGDSVMAEESELGEFLMDTFEGLDAMEVNALLTASV